MWWYLFIFRYYQNTLLTFEGKHIKSQYRQPTNKWDIMKIYYGADLVNDYGGGECYSNKHYLERRRHGVPEIVKFITLPIQSTYLCAHFCGNQFAELLRSEWYACLYNTSSLYRYKPRFISQIKYLNDQSIPAIILSNNPEFEHREITFQD